MAQEEGRRGARAAGGSAPGRAEPGHDQAPPPADPTDVAPGHGDREVGAGMAEPGRTAEQGPRIEMMTREQVREINRYDLRRIIGALLVVYGIILVIASFFVSDRRSLGVDINLWTGLGLLVVGGTLLGLGLARPIVPRDQVERLPRAG